MREGPRPSPHHGRFAARDAPPLRLLAFAVMSLIVITGAAGALGSALAVHLAEQGHGLALMGAARHAPRLAELEQSLSGRVFSAAFDGAAAADFRAQLDAIEARAGEAVTHAALTAGGWAGGSPLHETTDDSAYLAMMQSNADSVYHTLRALLPSMVAARSGSVVVIGSRNVARPWTGAGSAAYSASKSAAVALASAAAAEVLGHGVRINSVLVSTMDTAANRAAMPDADPGAWVTLRSAATVIAFLLSEDARDISGAEIPVYGRA